MCLAQTAPGPWGFSGVVQPKNTTSRARFKGRLWFALIKNQRKMFQMERNKNTKSSANKLRPQNDFVHIAGLLMLAPSWDTGLIQRVICVWSQVLCSSNSPINSVVIKNSRELDMVTGEDKSWLSSLTLNPISYIIFSCFSFQLLRVHFKMKNCKNVWKILRSPEHLKLLFPSLVKRCKNVYIVSCSITVSRTACTVT